MGPNFFFLSGVFSLHRRIRHAQNQLSVALLLWSSCACCSMKRFCDPLHYFHGGVIKFRIEGNSEYLSPVSSITGHQHHFPAYIDIICSLLSAASVVHLLPIWVCVSKCKV